MSLLTFQKNGVRNVLTTSLTEMSEDFVFHIQGFLQSYFCQKLTFSLVTNLNFTFKYYGIF